MGRLLPLALFAFAGYDPLATGPAGKTAELAMNGPEGRELPLLAYLPAATSPAPVILFSHGLGGSRHGSSFLGRHWSARGYVCVFLQHPGSDESVWREESPGKRMTALRGAGDVRNFQLRVRDVRAVLDQLEKWNAAPGHALHRRMDLSRIGMSGHSFGAITTQAVSGQRYRAGQSFTDPRIKAALPMSPSSPATGTAAQAFGAVPIPWMLMTGTNDTAPIGNQSVESRLQVYPALPPGRKYELVLDGAAHSVFTDRPLPGSRDGRNPNHHRAIVALSTAFWDATLRGDPAAQAWLDGAGPRSVLEPGDRFQRK
jgi:predicted dienelactone hydrolase